MTTLFWIICILIALWLLFRGGNSKALMGDLPGPGTYLLDVVGESNYQEALYEIVGEGSDESAEFYIKAELHIENNNKYDKNAVRVDIDGHTVGYLSRENARLHRKELKRLGQENLSPIGCDAVIRGGWVRDESDKGMIGVKLDLPIS